MQKGLFQIVEGGEFLAVEGFEAEGFGAEIVEPGDNFLLLPYRREGEMLVLKGSKVNIVLRTSLALRLKNGLEAPK